VSLFEPVPVRYVVPNAITCAGMCLGLWAVQAAVQARLPQDLALPAWLVLWATITDKLDGTVARRLQATSAVGVQLDSFSDLVTFGLAPAALVSSGLPILVPQVWAAGWGRVLLAVLCGLYVVAAALRLARFNVTTTGNPSFFQGMPTTASGGVLAAFFLTLHVLGAPPAAFHAMAVLVGLHALLMVSNLPLPKLQLGRHRFWRVVMAANVLAVYVLVPLSCNPFHSFSWTLVPPYLLALSAGYVVVGFAYGIRVGGGATRPASA
jgi:CDP-diacylglycerol--serine O-phosphatidyltransferase